MARQASEAERAKAAIRQAASDLGFAAIGFAPAALDDRHRRDLAEFLGAGHHGTMDWLARREAERGDPVRLWPEARSVIALGLDYAPAEPPLATLEKPDKGNLSVYARNRDYHDILKKKLKALARRISAHFPGSDFKVFVDTAPVMEKPLAELAGIGWQGKHTNLVSREWGSWLFLGEIFTTLELPADPPHRDRCGNCRRCLDACPTGALPAPYRIDARRCISYLTIEHKGPIPRDLRPLIGNRIYGCDDCLAVCPWNKFAKVGYEIGLAARPDLIAPDLADLAGLDDAGFRRLFAGSPVKRIGRDRFLRNVLIAIGNSGKRDLGASAEARLADSSPLVRGAAIWALSRLLPAADFGQLRQIRAGAEADSETAQEWRMD